MWFEPHVALLGLNNNPSVKRSFSLMVGGRSKLLLIDTSQPMSRKVDVPAVFAWVSGGYLSAISTTAHLLCHAHSRITDYKAQSDGFALVNIHLAAAQS